MWIRIKGQLYNLALATSVDCNLKEQTIVICFGSAGVIRGVDQHFHTYHDSAVIEYSEDDGDQISDCHEQYRKILAKLNVMQDDTADFGKE